jgi:phosphoribosyl 1,2-cyclic phosphodiesterase
LHGIKEVSSIILTHGHADAILGLDDVRDLQRSKLVTVTKDVSTVLGVEGPNVITGFQIVGGAMPIFLHQETMDVVKKTFSYLTAPPEYLDESALILSRRIALLKFNVIDPDAEFCASGLPVRSFPVFHGGEYISLGFSIGKEGEFVYISDVKIIPESTMEYLRSIPQINTLVIDALNRIGIWPHMGLEEALAVVETLRPKVAYFTGMACDMGMHDEIEAELAIRAPNTHLAFDGLVLDNYEIGSPVVSAQS